jgi:hypothetical protein
MGRPLASPAPREASKPVAPYRPGYMYDIMDSKAELEERLDCIDEIYRIVDDSVSGAKYAFTRIDFAALLVMPRIRLLTESDRSRYEQPLFHWVRLMDFVEGLLGFCKFFALFACT